MKHVTLAAALVSSIAAPAFAHSKPDPDVSFCLSYAELGKGIAKARDAGYDEATVLNALLRGGLFDAAPQFSYRIVREVFESPLGPEEIREAGFINCMEAMK